EVDQIYSDGINSIAIVGGAARIDLVIFSPTERDANGQATQVPLQRIVMSMEGFVRSANKMAEAVQSLEKMGVIQRAAGTAPAPDVSTPAAAPAQAPARAKAK